MTESIVPKKKRKANFPYESFDQALKDGFQKIGGRIGAFRCMQKGYKTIIWRKRAETNKDEVEKIQAEAQKKAAEKKV
jgi:hypothetical protein